VYRPWESTCKTASISSHAFGAAVLILTIAFGPNKIIGGGPDGSSGDQIGSLMMTRSELLSFLSETCHFTPSLEKAGGIVSFSSIVLCRNLDQHHGI
jgi:hypothetical protein